MPKYCYKCKKCGSTFEIRHSMDFEDQRCIECDSKLVFRVPSLSNSTRQISSTRTQRPGQIVDEYIQSTKQEIKKEKNKLKTEEL